jgi:hypothetical protein
MECEQLIRLIKDWYVRVKQETMAPARMMQFVDQHVKGCRVCQTDLLLPEEVEKIRDFILPEAKIPKIRSSDDSSTPEISPDEGDEMDEDGEFSDDSDEDLDDPVDEEDNLSGDDII